MSNLLTGIAPQASLLSQGSAQNGVQQNRNAQGNLAQSQANQQAIASGIASSPAALVSISSSAKDRVASYGEGRSVDATFESEERREGPRSENIDEQEAGEEVVNRSLDVEA